MKMIDVGSKAKTARVAKASARLRLSAAALEAVVQQRIEKGDVLAAARLAGVMGAKQTAFLIPLCHPLPLTNVEVQVSIEKYGLFFESTVKTLDRTGVEMEALTAVTCAALTAYDMLKSFGQDIEIERVCLEHKSGGRTGDYRRKVGASKTRK